jgi:NADPH2:quinone reductase
MKALKIDRAGGLEVLELADLPDPVPGPGEALVEIAAAGVNFMDIGVRRGVLWTETPYPKVLGVEGAGRIVDLGEGVSDFAVGDRVAWVYAPGSYADRITIPADALVAIPDHIEDRIAAATMMQGLTASHFANDFYPVQLGDVALVHAAAGGVGLILVQLIKARGGRVIARVSSAEKIGAAIAAGADEVIVGSDGAFAEQVVALTGGEGVHVVYDGSGPVTFADSVASLRRSGTLCWYGPVLGADSAIALMDLPRSIKVGYAVFMDHISTPALLHEKAAALFEAIGDGRLNIHIGADYPLASAAEAHRDMEGRGTVGKLLLIP